MSVCLLVDQPSDFEIDDLNVSLCVFSRSHSYSRLSVVWSVSPHGHVGVLDIYIYTPATSYFLYSLHFLQLLTVKFSQGLFENTALFPRDVSTVSVDRLVEQCIPHINRRKLLFY